MKICKKWYGYKHDWSKWEVVSTNTLESYYPEYKKQIVIGHIITQKRKCLICGFVEYNKQTIKI